MFPETTQQAHRGTLGNQSKGKVTSQSDCQRGLSCMVYWQRRLVTIQSTSSESGVAVWWLYGESPGELNCSSLAAA